LIIYILKRLIWDRLMEVGIVVSGFQN